LQDDCVNTTVDLDWVWDLIHLTSNDKTYRLDLDGLKKEVQGWFDRPSLDELMGKASDETSTLAREWLVKDGKRWRPYLAACAYMALQSDKHDEPPVAPATLKKVAVAVECFHKASLIHDDIEDNDEKRYGTATLHAEVGVPVAIDVLDIFRQKTAPAFEVALTLGAFLGEADPETHEVLRKYSESLGIAYQI